MSQKARYNMAFEIFTLFQRRLFETFFLYFFSLFFLGYKLQRNTTFQEKIPTLYKLSHFISIIHEKRIVGARLEKKRYKKAGVEKMISSRKKMIRIIYATRNKGENTEERREREKERKSGIRGDSYTDDD